jgi:serine/threonine protein kinase
LLRNKVAVKVLNAEFAGNSNIRSRFLAEARNMARMSHFNVIKVTDLIETPDLVAFVMEYIEGESLKEYIERKGALGNDEIKIIFSQMLAALSYVHENNLVHRDIKPSNFMIDKEGRVKLMDFGIAKSLDATASEYTQTGTGTQMGTPMYMSPEQIKSSKDVGLQTDIYSLGVILWQMVTGSKPYDVVSISSFEMQFKIVQEDLPSTKTIWDNCIKAATQKNLNQRIKSTEAFRLNLPGIESEQTIVDVEKRTKLYDANVNSTSKIKGSENKTVTSAPINKKILFIGCLILIGFVVFNIYQNFIKNSSENVGSIPPDDGPFWEENDTNTAPYNEINNAIEVIEYDTDENACAEGLCDYICFRNSNKYVFNFCCDFIIINGQKEKFAAYNPKNINGKSLYNFYNSDWLVDIEYREIFEIEKVGAVNMNGEMVVTNRKTGRSKSFQIEGSVNND